MKHRLIIDSNGKAIVTKKFKVLPSLPYYGIARRLYNSGNIKYDREIDISVMLTPSK